MIAKIASFIAMRRAAAANSVLFQKLLAAAGAVIALSLTAAFLASLLIAGLTCLAYNLLVQHGMTPQSAMIMMGVALFFVLVALIVVICYCGREAKKVSTNIVMMESPLLGKVYHIAESFVDGFMGRRSK